MNYFSSGIFFVGFDFNQFRFPIGLIFIIVRISVTEIITFTN